MVEGKRLVNRLPRLRRRGRCMTVNEFGKMMFFAGLLIAAVGLLLWTGVGRGWFGQLPGDIHVRRGNVGFYFPVVTCLLISIILTVLLWLFRR